MEIKHKEISLQIVVYEDEMFLRIKIDEETLDLPYRQAEEMRKMLERMVPYSYGQPAWHEPVKFKGRKAG